MTDSFEFSPHSSQYCEVSKKLHTKKGGGVGIYVAEKLQHKLCKDLNVNIENTIESTFIEIATETGKNIIVGVVYRPPNNDRSKCFKML
jgi:exonuclease III